MGTVLVLILIMRHTTPLHFQKSSNYCNYRIDIQNNESEYLLLTAYNNYISNKNISTIIHNSCTTKYHINKFCFVDIIT